MAIRFDIQESKILKGVFIITPNSFKDLRGEIWSVFSSKDIESLLPSNLKFVLDKFKTVVNYKINNFLSYKLGFAMYKLKNNIFYMLVMLFIIKKNHLFFQENRINKRLYRHLGKMAIFAYKNWYNNQGVRALKKIIKMLKSV